MSILQIKNLEESIDAFESVINASPFYDTELAHTALYIVVTNMLCASEYVQASLVDKAMLERALRQLRLFVCANNDLLSQHMSKIGAELKNLLDDDSEAIALGMTSTPTGIKNN